MLISISHFSQQMRSFHFSSIDKSTVMKEIDNLKPKKATQDIDTPVKNLMLNCIIFAECICFQFNVAISSSQFPASFKFTDVTPVFKNRSRIKKDDFNPVQDGLLRGCSLMEGGRAKRPPSLKPVTHILQWWNFAQLYLTQRRSKKYMNHVTHPLSSADISIFSPKISKFCYIKKYRFRLDFDT